MLTTKVVSNKKPPLLSDSESGGSTSPIEDKRKAITRKIQKDIDNDKLLIKRIEKAL